MKMRGRLRCPKVAESNELEDVTDGAFGTDGTWTVVLTLGLAGEMTILPCLSEAALVIRGATTGAAVEATLMVSA